ncbi:transmembrane emp24 domain-containing protein p24beta2 [Medicago truncatula]|uniref:transmembrane emp24 domain-containing protein p24beta2 n=1 Tax=Medicago truncatula TaxID=3880 RepID=UPI001966DBFB|nr:transmembrane emp24 domain-containing protein p24beta2 [Medicago truncatula]
MKVGPPNVAIAMAILLLCNMNGVLGIRFVIDREECFSHYVQYEGDAVHASFVVISVTDSTWHLTQEGLDLTVRGPNGDQIREFRDKTSEKFDFVAHTKGPYRFCFTNKSPYREKIDFDVHSNHFSTFEQHAQDGESCLN